MDFAFPFVAFLAALFGSRRSLGAGLTAVCAVGYFNGVVRANYLGVFTTFMFDAAVLGLYLGHLTRTGGAGLRAGRGGAYVLLLVTWPALLSFVPVNDLLVQLVALRATVWFLPVVLLARTATSADLVLLARGLAALNLVALAGGIYVYSYGVESLYPNNAVTYIIYASRDVAGFQHHRVPSTFLSAAGYGGTMLLTLPVLLGHLLGARVVWLDRVLAGVGIVAAAGGILLCASRTPIVLFVVSSLVAWVLTRFSSALGLVVVGLFVAGGAVAVTDDRLQRASSLEDTEMVGERVRSSAHDSFGDLLLSYPLGAGMGSAAGTSLPFFLADRAPEPVGLENEYCRILVDQGWLGLGLWVAFLGWLFARPPAYRSAARWGLGVVLMYALTAASWATAFLGTGVLSGVPGAVLLLAQMGVLLRLREPDVLRPGDPPPEPAPRPGAALPRPPAPRSTSRPAPRQETDRDRA